jgi:hypothetical protein
MPSVPIFIEAEIGNKPVAKVVAKVFDNFNNLKSGSLSVDNFQDIVDPLAKGFLAGELDTQTKLVHPGNTGHILSR